MQDKSEQKRGTTMAVPVRERVERHRLRGLTTHSGTMAQFGRMVLKSVRKIKGLGLGLFRNTQKRRRERGHQ
jgi:hypothetical protein